eukprot:scaffold8847_cov112-Isochrysis_galbana.AAC.11
MATEERVPQRGEIAVDVERLPRQVWRSELRVGFVTLRAGEGQDSGWATGMMKPGQGEHAAPPTPLTSPRARENSQMRYGYFGPKHMQIYKCGSSPPHLAHV